MLKTTLTTALFTLVVASPAFAADVAILPVTSTNLSQGESDAVAQLLAKAYRAELGADVIDPSAITGADPIAAARDLGAREYVKTTAIKLNEKIIVASARHRIDGPFIFGCELTASGVDDLEQVTQRIAMSLVRQLDEKETRTHENVTLTEAKKKNRIFNEKIMGFKTGLVLPFASGMSVDPSIPIMFDGRLEGETYFLEIGAGLLLPTMSNDNSQFFALLGELGGSYYLTDGEASIYVGGGISPRILSLGNDGVIGLAPYLQGGVMLFRSSSTRMFADLRVAQNVIGMQTGERTYSNTPPYESTRSGEKAWPTELWFSVGMGF